MATFLQRPFPPYVYSRRTWKSVFITALMVFGILFFLQPFGLNEVSHERRFALSLSFGAATLFVVAGFVLLLPLMFPDIFDSRRWTVGKEIIFFCVMLSAISLANVLVNMWTQNIPFSFGMMLSMVGYTLLVGVAPVTLSVFVKQQILLRRFQREANALNAMVTSSAPPAVSGATPHETPEATPQFLLSGDNQSESLTLMPDEWMAAEANDNYVRIFFEKASGSDSALFRTTLKKLEAQLQGHAGIYRCHKSFLVNLQKVSHLSGNAQGYRLHLKSSDLQVPVSRSLNAELKEKMGAIRR